MALEPMLHPLPESGPERPEPTRPAERSPRFRPPPRTGRPRAGGLRWFAAEFAVVVAGILVALALQAWWEGRADVARERDYLRQLLADTRENDERVENAVASDSLASVDLARLAGRLYGSEPLPPPDSVVAWFAGNAFSSSDFQPLSGTLGALLSTGDLRLIRTDALRARLVAYAAMLEHEEAMMQFFLAQGFGDPGRVARPMPFLRRLVFDGPDAVRARNVDFERLRRDPEVEAALFGVQIANANRLTHLRRLRDETRRLLQALEAEVAVRGAR